MRLADATKQQIVKEYQSGKSSWLVAKEFGISKSTVRYYCDKFGVPMRRSALGRTGADNPYWRGGRHVTSGGYIWAYILPDDPFISMAVTSNGRRYVPEHRLVMARLLGRPLRADETVHHLNGLRDDNRLENLQLRQGQHGKGVKLVCGDCGSHNIEPAEI